MEKNLSQAFRSILPVIIFLSLFSSCRNTFDIKPENALKPDQVYRNVFDADAAVIGIYGKLLGIAERYVILNELRGDLTDVTTNSDQYLKQLNTHNVSDDNPYADPRPFYEIIMNCNDALKNFDVMLQNNRLTVNDYNLRYSDIGAIRSWLYLQVGIHFGNVPYVTDPIADINDLKDESKFPRLSFDDLLDKLISFTAALPYKDPFPAGTSLLTTVDTYNTEKFFINKKCLLGDLYLWKGDYTQAAVRYHDVMNYADVLFPARINEQWWEVYKVAFTANLNGANWVNIFRQPYGERYSNYEIIWDLPFDKNFSPVNPFINLFDNTTGSYLLKPSALAIQNWDKQVQTGDAVTNNTPGDLRGRGASWKMTGAQPVVNKYTYNYSPALPFETNGKWILYRAAVLHLRYAEAANRDGRNRLAFGLLNQGIKNAFDPNPELASSHETRDVTNMQQSFGAPYDFDARMGDFPIFRAAWYRNVGIRTRASVKPLALDSVKYFNMNSPEQDKPVTDREELTLDIEDKLIAEDGLELAYEGYRWPDLLRAALRRQSSDPGYLANKIAAKFDASGNAAAATEVRTRLANKANWYLPFKWK